MINWKVSVKQEVIEKENWYFANFHVQEYLLPIINVGKKYIDEYGDEQFSTEDCLRIKANIEYIRDPRPLNNKDEIHYDSWDDGLVVLSSKQVMDSLLALYEAVEIAIAKKALCAFMVIETFTL